MLKKILAIGNGEIGTEKQVYNLLVRIIKHIHGRNFKQSNSQQHLRNRSNDVMIHFVSFCLNKKIDIPNYSIDNVNLNHLKTYWNDLFSSPLVPYLPASFHVSCQGWFNNPLFGYNKEVIWKQLNYKQKEKQPIIFNEESPDIIIASGRLTAPLALGLQSSCDPKPFLIQIQHPRVSINKYYNKNGAIITPMHDFKLVYENGIHSTNLPSNVFTTLGSIPPYPNTLLNSPKKTNTSNTFRTNDKIIGVLVGGSCKRYYLSKKKGIHLAQQITELYTQSNKQLKFWLTFSRRTSPPVISSMKHVLRQSINAHDLKIYDGNYGSIENPYEAILLNADGFIITPDSISMLTEAAYTNKPIGIYDMINCHGKFQYFYQSLMNLGNTQPFLPSTFLTIVESSSTSSSSLNTNDLLMHPSFSQLMHQVDQHLRTKKEKEKEKGRN